MKVVIAGLGVQGFKRKFFLNKNQFVASVDPYKKEAAHKSISAVPLSSYDTVFICTPENEKLKLINFCLKNKKNFLIEKPFPVLSLKKFNKLKLRIKKSKIICYVGYNHRFEPFIIKLKNFLKKKLIGSIYSFKIFYGNGTARLIKKSSWRDKGNGVVDDLFPHMLDLVYYLYDKNYLKLNLLEDKNTSFICNKFENKSTDNAILQIKKNNTLLRLEASYCSWKNKFYCEIIGKKGSLHLNSLSKWGKVTLKYRKRVLPSGAPKERLLVMKKKDVTWKNEHTYFKKLILIKKKNNLHKEFWINKNLIKLKNIMT